MRNAYQQKLVTVIVPTIGRPQYIKDAVRSIIEQDYKNIEILISDNAPEVSSQEVLGGCADEKIKFIKREKRLSFSEHMNMCFNDAQGFFVMILSDDDLLSPTYISNMVRLFGEESLTVAVGAQVALGEKDDCIESVLNVKENTVVDGFEYIINQLSGNSSFPIFTFLSLFAKKDDIISEGCFKLYSDGAHVDNYLFHSLAMKGKVGFSSECSMGYRIYSSSCGLSMPFKNLLSATSEYDRDMAGLIWKIEGQSFFNRAYLRYLLKKSSALMMIGRLRSIYKMKLGSFSGLKNIMKIILFILGRRWVSK